MTQKFLSWVYSQWEWELLPPKDIHTYIYGCSQQLHSPSPDTGHWPCDRRLANGKLIGVNLFGIYIGSKFNGIQYSDEKEQCMNTYTALCVLPTGHKQDAMHDDIPITQGQREVICGAGEPRASLPWTTDI